MASTRSSGDPGYRPVVPIPVKIVIAGGFGVGKTTLVGAVSEITPLTTEAAMTSQGQGYDDPGGVAPKTTTTVAMDFGRITVDESLVLYLFGTPGQDRFGFMWDDLALGALGAVALVDTRRIEDCFPALDYFEKHDLPFVVGVNVFEGTAPHHLAEVRAALDVDPDVPVLFTDARSLDAVKQLLLALLDLVLAKATARAAARA
jgi:signal recognition particle receptor subunit beta